MGTGQQLVQSFLKENFTIIGRPYGDRTRLPSPGYPKVECYEKFHYRLGKKTLLPSLGQPQINNMEIQLQIGRKNKTVLSWAAIDIVIRKIQLYTIHIRRKDKTALFQAAICKILREIPLQKKTAHSWAAKGIKEKSAIGGQTRQDKSSQRQRFTENFSIDSEI